MPEFGYKIFELIGNLLDWGAFWVGMVAGKNKKLEDLGDRMYSWQDDCYFYQCLIELGRAVRGLVRGVKEFVTE